jgi:tetratricopeptide (TPR) repeat protein
MNRTLFSLIFIGCFVSLAIGQTKPESLFNEGNKYYAEGKYEDAISKYDSVISLGFESAELFLNMGNAYYKLRNYPKAILGYERALLNDPGNEKAKHNLAKAQVYTIDKIDQIPEFLITGWMNHLVMTIHSNSWALISLIAFILGFLSLLAFFLSIKVSVKRLGFYSGILFLSMAFTGFYLAYQSKKLLISSNGAIVMTPTVTLKSSPSISSTNLFIVHEGTKVYIMDKIDDWYEIKLSDGKTGWLESNDVEPI